MAPPDTSQSSGIVCEGTSTQNGYHIVCTGSMAAFDTCTVNFNYDLTSTVDVPAVASPGATTGWAYKPANGSLKLNLSAGELGFDW